MTYSFTCTCGEVLTAEAQNDEEAVEMLMPKGKTHIAQAHPEMPAMSDEQMREMLKTGMKKEEAAAMV